MRATPIGVNLSPCERQAGHPLRVACACGLLASRIQDIGHLLHPRPCVWPARGMLTLSVRERESYSSKKLPMSSRRSAAFSSSSIRAGLAGCAVFWAGPGNASVSDCEAGMGGKGVDGDSPQIAILLVAIVEASS